MSTPKNPDETETFDREELADDLARASERIPVTQVQHSLPDVQDLLIGRRLSDRYRIEKLLGRGGMGAVYHAHDEALGRRCAVKVLPETLAAHPDLVARFDREARATAALAHPNVVTIFDVGTDHGRPFLAMEYLEGTSLDTVLSEQGPFDPADAVEIACQAASGLEAAHAKSIIHRDVKPANLMRLETGEVKVMDFGLARLTKGSSDLSQSGTVLGTLHYMSPEQAGGEDLDPRADVYSLGATLFALVVGKPPFTADNPAALLLKLVTEDPPPPHELRASVPPMLSAVILRMMARKREQRYESMAECRADLERFRRGESVEAKAPPSAPPRQLMAAGVGVVAVLLIAAVALFGGGPGAGSGSEGSGSAVVDDSAEVAAYEALREVLASDAEPSAKLAACEQFTARFPKADSRRQNEVLKAQLRLKEAVETQRADAEIAEKLDEIHGRLVAHEASLRKTFDYPGAIAICDEYLGVAPEADARAQAVGATRQRLESERDAHVARLRKELAEPGKKRQVQRVWRAARQLDALGAKEDATRARAALRGLLESLMAAARRARQLAEVEKLIARAGKYAPTLDLSEDAAWLQRQKTIDGQVLAVEKALQRKDHPGAQRALDVLAKVGDPWATRELARLRPKVEALRKAVQGTLDAATLRRIAAADQKLADGDLDGAARLIAQLARVPHPKAQEEVRRLKEKLAAARRKPTIDVGRARGLIAELEKDLRRRVQRQRWDEARRLLANFARRTPLLAEDAAIYKAHVDAIEAVYTGLGPLLEGAFLDGRKATALFAKNQFPRGSTLLVEDGKLSVAVKSAKIAIEHRKLGAAELYKLAKLVKYKEPLTARTTAALMLYNDRPMQARFLVGNSKLGLDEAQLGPVLVKWLGAEWPTGSLKRVWGNLRAGKIRMAGPLDLRRPDSVFHRATGTLKPVPRGLLLRNTLAIGRYTPLGGVEATFAVERPRHVVQNARVGVLLRYQVYEEDSTDKKDIFYVEYGVRLDEPKLVAYKRNPTNGSLMREVIKGVELPAPLPAAGGQVNMRLDWRRGLKQLRIQVGVDGSTPRQLDIDFADRRPLGFAIFALGTQARLVRLWVSP